MGSRAMRSDHQSIGNLVPEIKTAQNFFSHNVDRFYGSKEKVRSKSGGLQAKKLRDLVNKKGL